jgi:hypothetical protein
MDFDLVGSPEVVYHIASCFLIAVIKDIVFWIHVPSDLMHFVSPVGPVLRHHDGSLELSVNV